LLVLLDDEVVVTDAWPDLSTIGSRPSTTSPATVGPLVAVTVRLPRRHH
jgi:hypothetical protein